VSDAKWAAIKDEFAAFEDYEDFSRNEPDAFGDKRRQVEHCWWVYDRFLRPQGQHLRRGRTRYPE